MNIIDIGDVNTLTDIINGMGGNVSVDPVFVDIDGADDDITTMDDNDWHLTGSTTTDISTGGLNLSADFTTDKDGVTRTDPWSMGCYEFD